MPPKVVKQDQLLAKLLLEQRATNRLLRTILITAAVLGLLAPGDIPSMRNSHLFS